MTISKLHGLAKEEGLDEYRSQTDAHRPCLLMRAPRSVDNLEEADFELTSQGVLIRYRDIGEFGTFERLALATTTEGLHILGVTTNGQLWHQLQRGLSTQPARGQQFRDVELIGVGADVGEFTAIAAA